MTAPVRAAACALGLGALTGCPASQTYVQKTSASHRGAVGAATASGSGSTGSAATNGTSGASTGTSSGGSTSSGGGCPSPSTCDPRLFDGGLSDCAPSQLELVANLIDFCLGGAPVTCPVVASDLSDPAVQAASTGCGLFHFCFDAGAELQIELAVDNYWPTIFANVQPTTSTVFPGSLPDQGVPVFCNGPFFAALTASIPINVELASVTVEVYSLNEGSAACDSTKAGWTFWLQALDGGVVDAGTAILTGTDLGSGDVTSADGVEILYNIDPAIGTVRVVGLQVDAGLPDGGSACPLQIEQPPFFITGSVDVIGGKFSFFPYIVQ